MHGNYGSVGTEFSETVSEIRHVPDFFCTRFSFLRFYFVFLTIFILISYFVYIFIDFCDEDKATVLRTEQQRIKLYVRYEKHECDECINLF